jgi:MSHA pilin protein MshC
MVDPLSAERRWPARVSSSGFTVVELVVVMVLIGTVLAVGAPRFFAARGFDESFFRNDTLGALRYAQKLAVATGCQVQVTINGSGYTLKGQDGDPCSGSSFNQNVAHPGTGVAGYSNAPPGGISVSSDVSPIVFDALGRALNSGGSVSDVTVDVGSLQVLVVGETGFAYVP